MTGSLSNAALRSKWDDMLDSGTSNLPETGDVSKSLNNVIGWFKQVT